LVEIDWLPVHIWEHEDLDVAASSLREIWVERTAS